MPYYEIVEMIARGNCDFFAFGEPRNLSRLFPRAVRFSLLRTLEARRVNRPYLPRLQRSVLDYRSDV